MELKSEHLNVENLPTPELAALPRAAKGLQVIDSFLLVGAAMSDKRLIKTVEDLMGSFGPTAGFSASLLGEPSPPSWLPCIYSIFLVYSMYISYIVLAYTLYISCKCKDMTPSKLLA